MTKEMTFMSKSNVDGSGDFEEFIPEEAMLEKITSEPTIPVK